MSDKIIYENVRIWLESLGYALSPPSPDVLREMQHQHYSLVRGERHVDKAAAPESVYAFITNRPDFVNKQPEFKKLYSLVREPNARMFVVSEYEFKAGILGFIDKNAGNKEIRCVPCKIFKTNIHKQRGVPPQRLCTPEEAAVVLSENRVKIEDLPYILPDDAMCIWLDARPGMIVRSARPNQAPFYRVVKGGGGMGDVEEGDEEDES